MPCRAGLFSFLHSCAVSSSSVAPTEAASSRVLQEQNVFGSNSADNNLSANFGEGALSGVLAGTNTPKPAEGESLFMDHLVFLIKREEDGMSSCRAGPLIPSSTSISQTHTTRRKFLSYEQVPPTVDATYLKGCGEKQLMEVKTVRVFVGCLSPHRVDL